MLCVGDSKDTLDDISDSEALVHSLAEAINAIDVLQCFVRLNEGAERALNALVEFESHAQPLVCANTQAKITNYFRN